MFRLVCQARRLSLVKLDHMVSLSYQRLAYIRWRGMVRSARKQAVAAQWKQHRAEIFLARRVTRFCREVFNHWAVLAQGRGRAKRAAERLESRLAQFQLRRALGAWLGVKISKTLSNLISGKEGEAM